MCDMYDPRRNREKYREPVPVEQCFRCGKDLFEGDTIYWIGNERWCEECVRDELMEVL